MGALLDRWTRAKSEIKLYDGQLVKITETAVFKKINSGSAPLVLDIKSELFRPQTKNIFNAIIQNLDPNGTDLSELPESHKSLKKRSVNSKEKLATDSFDFTKENATDGLFKSVNQNKVAAKLDKKDFEVSISAHRTPVVNMESWKDIIVDGKIPSFIQSLANYLLNLDYDILLIKNNQITVLIDGSQYSVRLTGKAKIF
jgi:hypothetical protein